MGEVIAFKSRWERARENFHATQRHYYVLVIRGTDILKFYYDIGDIDVNKYYPSKLQNVTDPEDILVICDADGIILYCNKSVWLVGTLMFPDPIPQRPELKPEPAIKSIWRNFNKLPYYKEDYVT